MDQQHRSEFFEQENYNIANLEQEALETGNFQEENFRRKNFYHQNKFIGSFGQESQAVESLEQENHRFGSLRPEEVILALSQQVAQQPDKQLVRGNERHMVLSHRGDPGLATIDRR